MKSFTLLLVLIVLTLQVTIKTSEQCSLCNELKSQKDCENPSSNMNCKWDNSICIDKPKIIYKEYCEQIEDPGTKCSKTFGCAYVDSKCTHFTGCTAYVKTTQTDCQAISYQCTSNGVTCDDIQECSKYSSQLCETLLSINSPHKCKLEDGKCRDFKCSEASSTLNTDQMCMQWKVECVTTGMGCTDTRLPCNQYVGDSQICSQMIGSDGKCSLDTGTTCKKRVCSEAKLTVWDDTTCNDYQIGCKSTGFSCVSSYQSCTNYDGDAIKCLNYIGQEGLCAWDAKTQKCRARICEDKASGILKECTDYKPGCLTNGVNCITLLQNCNKYTGTKNVCKNIIGLDGNCKGTSDADNTIACTLKSCADDDLGNEKTDAACQLIQKSCKTNGQGCMDTLLSCTSYLDNGDCLNYIGLEGKCKAGTNTKCAARLCSDITSAKTNEECQNYLPGCVSNGSGCIQETSCSNTVSQQTCSGTNNNYTCGWTASCVTKDCTAFQTNQSLCVNTKLSESQPCIWKENSCFNAKCSDFIETEDAKCDFHMKGCITNGTTCADPTQCNEFQGTMSFCRNINKAKCTNTDDSVAQTTPCLPKTCGDNNIIANSDLDCSTYLQGCLFSGNNKCISSLAACSEYNGSSAEDCKNFSGYMNSTARAACWWEQGSNCVQKICQHGTEMTNNTDCENFKSGCIFDGKDSCIDKDSGCTSFKFKTNASECQSQTGKNNTEKCYDGSGSYCKKRECSDGPISLVSDLLCTTFLEGCVFNGTGGCFKKTDSCSNYMGTSIQCSKFNGNSIPCLRKQKCVAPAINCENKTNATSTSQCAAYKPSCVLKFGSTNCQDLKANCSDYSLSGSSNNDKTAYCNSIQTISGTKCGYDSSSATACADRSCSIWNSSLGVSCESYASKCQFSDGVCSTPQNCASHTVPNGTNDKVAYCNSIQDSQGKKCTYNSDVSTTNCKSMSICEEAISPTSIDDCLDQTGTSYCFFINNACVTIKATCAEYDVTFGADSTAKTDQCNSLKSNNNGLILQCKYTSGNNCDAKTCEAISGATSQTNCNVLPNKCIYHRQLCFTALADCTSYQVPDAFRGTESQHIMFCTNMYILSSGTKQFCSYTNGDNCDTPKSCTENAASPGCTNKRDKTGVICKYVPGQSTCLAATTDKCSAVVVPDCDGFTQPLACFVQDGGCVLNPDCSSITPDLGMQITVCQRKTDSNGLYCSWTDGDKCEISKDTCAGWSGTSSMECGFRIDKFGNRCTWISGTTCTNKTCLNAISPTSQLDCDIISTGCFYYKGQCTNYQSSSVACTDYGIGDFDYDDDKFQFCNSKKSSSQEVCTFKKGSPQCVAAAPCNTFQTNTDYSSGPINFCKKHNTTDGVGCTYLSGTNCVKTDLCTSYVPTDLTKCILLSDNQGRPCIQGSQTCQYISCNNIEGPSQSECAKALNCIYSDNKCISQPTDCNLYSTIGQGGAIAYCNQIKDKNGNFCNAINDNDPNCTDRLCNDAPTLYFTTNLECINYSSNCKSDGLGCVDKSIPCTTFSGDSQSCSFYLDANGQSQCLPPTPAIDSNTCDSKTCDMNLTATNQNDCDNFIPQGGCRFKNPGCVSSDFPCSQYRGTQVECSNFIGNNIGCYSDSITRGPCRDKICADLKPATNDKDCAMLTGCVFNGVKCIDQSSQCNQFQGNNETCKNFIGNNGNTQCWSTSTTQGPCVDKQCTHLAFKSDVECNAFNINCITDGNTCVNGPRTCDQFRGNNDACSKFTASNGPCKSSSNSNTIATCTSRVCYEAPFIYTTDKQCSDYHPTCKTNGKGCQSNVVCGDIQNQTSCSANSLCVWTSSCRVASTTCQSLTSQGQSVCANNPTKKCAWQQGKGSSNSICRDYTCIDYESTLITHDACMKASNNQCTTTGMGCVSYGICSSYTTQSICAIAQTTEETKKCVWENSICRPLQCKDFKGSTNEECNTQLKNCKTNGTMCIGPNYDCSIFNGAGNFCLIDSQGQPCLYRNDICYPYDQCTDIISSSKSFCTTFSSNCVLGSTTCIALNQCSQYKEQISCYIGINKKNCGWLPEQKCAEFNKCSDAKGTNLIDCQNWNSSCISDGQVCVPIGECSSYLKQESCQNNYDTSNNACFWTGSSCKIKQCSDETYTTDADCVTKLVKEGLCTTDGTKCVKRAACQDYTNKEACTVGSDGVPCIFNHPIGSSTGTEKCQVQVCTDVLGTTHEYCKAVISKQPCVSNGKNCVNQGTCESYQSKFECQGGGSNNTQCVFIPSSTDSLTGQCFQFNECIRADADKSVCLSNQSCKYIDETKKCQKTDCATFNGNEATQCKPYPSFDGKSFTICIAKTNSIGCVEGDPTTLPFADCYSAISNYAYTWNTGSNPPKCQSCKTTIPLDNVTNNVTTTDSGFILEASIVLTAFIIAQL